jgi:hypothetical protein
MSEQFFTTGAVKDAQDKRDYRASGVVASIEIPQQKFVLEDLFNSKNQGPRGSCTSQAQTHHKERQEKTRLAARFVMAVVKSLIEGNTNWGAMTRNTFKAVKDWGVPKEEMLPEPGPEMTWEEYIDTNKISKECFDDALNHKSQSYWSVDRDIDFIRNVLLNQKQSVVISMAWYKIFNTPINGVLSIDFNGDYSGHAVEIKGFDDFNKWFIVKNSWGEGWGDKGDFYLPYSIFYQVVWDCWCSLDLPEDLPVDIYYGDKRTWTSYLREKAMGLNPWLLKQIGRLPTRREIIGLAYGYHDWTTVFKGYNGEVWLFKTKPQLIKEGFNYIR